MIEVGNNPGDKYIKVKFGGSESGVYNLFVTSKAYGRFDSRGMTLTLIGKVTDFNPKRGSIHGGTLITIDGYHFSAEATDNPVRIGYTDCIVESTSETQITCRTLPSMDQVDQEQDLVVFLKTYEEAVCEIDPCKFQWVQSALPAIESYTVDFDTTLGDFILTLSGSDFGSTQANTEIYVDGSP